MLPRLAPLLIALLAAPGVLAKDPPGGAGMTERPPHLRAALTDVLHAVHAQAGTKSVTLFLIEVTPNWTKQRLAADFLDTLPAAVLRWNRAGGDHRLGLAALADRPRLILRPTADAGRVAAALERLEALADGGYKNVFEGLRLCVPIFDQGKGERRLVAFCPENGDGEDHVEETIAALARKKITLHVLSRDAVLSDPYWETAARPAGLSADLQLAGPEAPERELPRDWTLQYYDPHSTVASGFGLYALARAAAATGGKYWLYYPASGPARSFCARYRCRLCGGSDQRCDLAYGDAALRAHETANESRLDYARTFARDPLARLVHAVWTQAAAGDLCRSGPPVLAGVSQPADAAGAGARRRDLPRGTLLDFQSDWQRLRADAEDARRECAQLAKTLADAIERQQGKSPSRVLAAARLLRFELLVARFNLGELSELARRVLIAHEAGWPGPVLPNATGPTDSFSVGYVFCCHGLDRLRRLDWLRGAAAAHEFDALAAAFDELQGDQYRHTPWGLTARRLGLVYFREEQVVESPATAVTPPRPRAQTRTPPAPAQTAAPETPKPPQRAEPPTRPASGQPTGPSTTPGR